MYIFHWVGRVPLPKEYPPIGGNSMFSEMFVAGVHFTLTEVNMETQQVTKKCKSHKQQDCNHSCKYYEDCIRDGNKQLEASCERYEFSEPG